MDIELTTLTIQDRLKELGSETKVKDNGIDDAVSENYSTRLAFIEVLSTLLHDVEENNKMVSNGSNKGNKESPFSCLKKVVEKECHGCRVAFSTYILAPTPCSHDYCIVCLKAIFDRSMSGKAFFPARCCNKTIPIKVYGHIFTPKYMVKYTTKEATIFNGV